MRKKFKFLFIIIACALVAVCAPFTATMAVNADGVAEIAMELDSGTVLHSKNADLRLPMASTTKIMTALIIAEESNLDDVVTIPSEAVGVEGSSIYLKYGETISVKDLLYGLMLRSGNDAACALSIIHSGTVEKFVDRMNARAQELGADNTHFANPSGLPCDEHFTTARDLCNIARHAMKNETFRNVVSTKCYNGEYRTFVNKNKLLSILDGANGIKTGYTQKAGRCLVSSAQRGGMDVVSVVLNCYDMFERSENIINTCFDKFSLETIDENKTFYSGGKAYKPVEKFTAVIAKDKQIDYQIKEYTDGNDDRVSAKLEIFCENDLLFSVNLYTIN